MNKYKKENRIGEKRLNNQGCQMKIIEYVNCDNIIIEFQDEYMTKINTQYYDFKVGNIKNPYHPSVYGVGIIGDKYPININGQKTKEYIAWKSMLQRSFDNKYKEGKPTYQDVICCEKWLLYENFYEWLHNQENFEKWLNNNKWSLDKDILIKGNKMYSPDTCCLVPNNVNSLFAKSDSKRTGLPIGVKKHQKKYRGSLSYLGKYINLPVRDTINEAFIDYKTHKENAIKQLAELEYSKGNITKQCYDSMMAYEVEITD